ncbi:MAG: hypothetical protein DELT_02958 [Desulfovibrio sp.]
MTITVTPGRPYSARVEYIACRDDVEDLLAKGYSARLAYELMKEQGRVTCSYSAFCDYVRGGGKRVHSKKKGRPKNSLQTPPRAGGPIIAGSSRESNKFEWPPKFDPKDLI